MAPCPLIETERLIGGTSIGRPVRLRGCASWPSVTMRAMTPIDPTQALARIG